jgi:lipoprotein-releasing system permease protein
MNLRLNIAIARSLLLARRRQTIVAAAGVAFGIAMFIGLLGFMTGLNQLLDGLMLNRTPHIRLYNEVKPGIHQPINSAPKYRDYHNFIQSVKPGNGRQEIYNSDAILKTLAKDKRVVGFAPKLIAQVFFNTGTIDITGVITGIDVESESRLFHFTDYIVAGSSAIDKLSNSIIVGKGLGNKLMANPGDVIQVTTITGERFQLKVAGFYQSGIAALDNTQSYASLATVQKLIGRPASYTTDIQIQLKDITAAPALAKEYAMQFDTDAEDIQTANAQFETGSSVRTLISYAVGITLLVVAGFGIYNILNMMIYEKMDSIAILKATGFSGVDVKAIFLLVAVSIGLIGGAAGLISGILISMLIDGIPFSSASLPAVTTYPVTYNPVFYFIAAIFSLITTFFAGWFPAQKASRVDPVVIIRGK